MRTKKVILVLIAILLYTTVTFGFRRSRSLFVTHAAARLQEEPTAFSTILAFLPFGQEIRNAIGWNPDAILIEERIGPQILSFKEPTEIVRYRFSDTPHPNMYVKGHFSIVPTFGDGIKKGGHAISIEAIRQSLIREVTAIINDISRLPRVINI